MKVQIRQGVFETNSSSTHAICIAKKHYFDKSKLPKKLVVPNYGFGWEPMKYRDPGAKASYLFQTIDYVYWNSQDEQERCKKKIYDVLRQYGIECEFELGEESYIDHGGIEDMPRWINDMVSDPDALMTYLFGDAMIVTGNDNGDEFNEEMHPFLGYRPYGYRIYDREKYNLEYRNYDIYEKGN